MHFPSLLRRTPFPGALLSGALLLGLGSSPAQAATFTVTNLNDGGVGSLRQAIFDANSAAGDDTILFNSSVFAAPRKTITLGGTQLPITSNIAIVGPAAGVVVSGNSASRVFEITSGTVSMTGLTISDGYPNANEGAAISIGAGSGSASGAFGGGIFNKGTLLLDRCTLSNNSSSYGGGAICSQTDFSGTTLTVRNCTLVGNTVVQSFGGGDAIFNVNGLAVIQNSTITGNTAPTGFGSGINSFAYNSTVYGRTEVENSIIAGNTNTDVDTKTAFTTDDDPGAFKSNGYNLIGDGGVASAFNQSGDQVIGDNSPGVDVLADNGGPTQTAALLRGSLAIDKGNSALTTDQRGVARDSKPDIGAFESVPVAPSIVSVTPQGATDKVGDKRTFSISVSDANGAGDIKETWLLINDRLNWSEGATLIYVPSASSPTNGLLYLRRGDAFLAPIQVGAGASSTDVLDNGAIRVIASDVTVTASGNSLTLSIPATIREGLVGQNSLFGYVADQADAKDARSLAGDMGFVRFGSYTVTSQFSGPNVAPVLSKLSPGATYTALNASGVAPGAQRFVFYVSDDNGTSDLESVWFLANKQLNWANSATVVYQPKTRRLFLRSDDGSTFLGGGQIGQAGIIENSQVRIDLSKVSVNVYPDGKSFGLTLLLQAKSGLLGQNTIWLRAQDKAGSIPTNSNPQGYVQSGTWSVVQGKAPNAPSAPSGGSS